MANPYDLGVLALSVVLATDDVQVSGTVTEVRQQTRQPGAGLWRVRAPAPDGNCARHVH